MRPALGAGSKWQIHFRGELRLPVLAGVSTRALMPRHPDEGEHGNAILSFLAVVAHHVGLPLATDDRNTYRPWEPEHCK